MSPESAYDIAIQKIIYLVDELKQIELLIKASDATSHERKSKRNPLPDFESQESFILLIEKRIASLLDEMIFEGISFEMQIACCDEASWEPIVDEGDMSSARAALFNHRDARLGAMRIISELNPDRKRSSWSDENFLSVSPRNSANHKSPKALSDGELQGLFDNFIYRLKAYLNSSFRQIPKKDLCERIIERNDQLKENFFQSYSDYTFQKDLEGHGWPPPIAISLIRQKSELSQTYIGILRDPNTQKSKLNFQSPPRKKSSQKHSEETSNIYLIFDQFFENLKKSNWPYPCPELISRLRTEYAEYYRFESFYKVSHIAAFSHLQETAAALHLLVECTSSLHDKLSHEELQYLRHLAILSADEMISIERFRSAPVGDPRTPPEFNDKLCSIWKDYAYHVYGKKTTTRNAWENENKVAIDHSTASILNRLSEIQENFLEARLMPILFFLVCVDTARTAFEKKVKLRRPKDDASLHQMNGCYSLLNENSNLFPKTQAVRKRQQDASVHLFSEINKVFSEYLLSGSLPHAQIDDTSTLYINEKTLAIGSEEYFPYIVVFHTQYAIQKIQFLLNNSIKKDCANVDIRNQKWKLFFKDASKIAEQFISLILAECRNANLASFPKAVYDSIPDQYRQHLAALLCITKTKYVLRFFLLGESCDELERSVNLLYDLVKQNRSTDASSTEADSTEASKTVDSNTNVSLKQKYITLAEEFKIVFEDISPYLFWAITEYDPYDKSLTYEQILRTYNSFPLSQMERLITYALPQSIGKLLENISEYYKINLTKCDPAALGVSPSNVIAWKYTCFLMNCGLKICNDYVSCSDFICFQKNIQHSISTVISEFTFDASQNDFWEAVSSRNILDEIKTTFSEKFEDLKKGKSENSKEIKDQKARKPSNSHKRKKVTASIIPNPSMSTNKCTIEEAKREFIGNYYLSIYLHSASEAVATVWERHFDRSKKKGSIPSPKHSLGKLAQKKWNFDTTEAFFNECPNFKSTTDFLEFLTQNIISPKKHTRILTDTDALAMAQYFEECLSWSRDCIIEKTWELISEYYKRFYPFRVSTFHLGLAKEYVEQSKALPTDGTMQHGAEEDD